MPIREKFLPHQATQPNSKLRCVRKRFEAGLTREDCKTPQATQSATSRRMNDGLSPQAPLPPCNGAPSDSGHLRRRLQTTQSASHRRSKAALGRRLRRRLASGRPVAGRGRLLRLGGIGLCHGRLAPGSLRAAPRADDVRRCKDVGGNSGLKQKSTGW